MADDPLKVLGIGPDNTLADVRERYRILCLKYHPDKNPGSEDMFRAVTEAYAKVRANPGMLHPQKTGGPVSYLDGTITLTMRDFYYAEEKSIALTRYSVCAKCDGTGAKDGKAAVCSYCAGQGIIDSSMMSILGRDGICPVCKGSGIMGDACPSCRGEKKVLESITAKFRATLYVYYNKHVLLKGLGNARSDGTYEDLMIRVRIHSDPYVTIEESYFVVSVNITPAQRASGDKCLLKLFDRQVPYTVVPGSFSSYAEDGIRPKFCRTVKVKFSDYIPELTKDTTKLYESIKDLEKKACPEIGQISCFNMMSKSDQSSQSKT